MRPLKGIQTISLKRPLIEHVFMSSPSQEEPHSSVLYSCDPWILPMTPDAMIGIEQFLWSISVKYV